MKTQGLRWTEKERYELKKNTVKWFFLRLFKKCSIFEGFAVDEPTTIMRRKKYLIIQDCLITENGCLHVAE